jgi:hypothetical protein
VQIVLELTAVVVAVRSDEPVVLVVDADGQPALPAGALDPARDRTLDRGMRRWAAERTGLHLGFVEQLYTFGDADRTPPGSAALGERRLSVAYLAFVRDGQPAAELGARWLPAYDLLAWEDRRRGVPAVVTERLLPALRRWVDAGANVDERAGRAERADLTWGLDGAAWDPVRSLERYELLFEAGLVGEAGGDRDGALGGPAAFDHRRILASALGRLRGKLTYRPVVFELLPPLFTLLQLQRLVEALTGVGLHKQNFRRLVEGAGLVEGTGERTAETGGRPAELFRFRREVLRERPAPGVGLPGRR